MTGVSKGVSYFIQNERIVIGRSQSADITIDDTKSSREHAELVRVGGAYVITDLKSHNGVIVNDKKIIQKTLEDGDQIIIGQTVFKYNKIDIEQKRPIVSLPSLSGNQDFPIEDKDVDVKKNKKNPIVFVMIAIGVLSLLMVDGDKKEVESKRIDSLDIINKNDDFSRSVLKSQEKENRELTKKLEVLYQKGLRELREKNYFRAMEEFNMALILSPQNSTASFYLKLAKQELDKEIESNIVSATKDRDALRYTKAMSTYCNVLKLLQEYPDDPDYIKTQKHLRDLEKQMDLEENEIKCF
jgi:pSer/pThr/pTyr-binding forkhead associated (FHA) protein